jgi:hypothetical protein
MAAEIELLGVSMALESCPDAVPTAWTMLDKSDAMMNSDRIDTAALCWSDTAGPVDNGDNVQDEEFFFFWAKRSSEVDLKLVTRSGCSSNLVTWVTALNPTGSPVKIWMATITDIELTWPYNYIKIRSVQSCSHP